MKKNDEEFNESLEGRESNKRYIRLFVIGIILLLIANVYLLYNFLTNVSWYSYIYPVAILIFGVYFMIVPKKLRTEEINRFNYYNRYRKKDKK